MDNSHIGNTGQMLTNIVGAFELLKADTCYKITVTQPTIVDKSANDSTKCYQNAPTSKGGAVVITYFIQGKYSYANNDKGTIIAKDDEYKLSIDDFDIYCDILQPMDMDIPCVLVQSTDGRVYFATNIADRRTRYAIETISYDQPLYCPNEANVYITTSRDLGGLISSIKHPIFIKNNGDSFKFGITKNANSLNAVYFRLGKSSIQPRTTPIDKIDPGIYNFKGIDNSFPFNFDLLIKLVNGVPHGYVFTNTTGYTLNLYYRENDAYIYGKLSDISWATLIIETKHQYLKSIVDLFDNEAELELGENVSLTDLTPIVIQYDYLYNGTYHVTDFKPGVTKCVLKSNKPIWWSGEKWIYYDGANAEVLRSGTFANKPASTDIYIGFRYFCTNRQTTEGATNGIEIIHKGNDVWVDALGRVVS